MTKHHDTHIFFGPITMSHPIAQFLPPETNTFEYWVEGVDLEWLEVMDEVWVLKLPGWETSTGVRAEITYALTYGLPLAFYTEEEVA